MSWYDTFMSDTVGTVYRAATGKVDPWTQAELADAAGQANQDAGGTYQAGVDTSNTATTAANATEATWLQAATTWTKAALNDDGTGCSLLTNPGGCVPDWLPVVLVVSGVVLVLWLLRPYVELANG